MYELGLIRKLKSRKKYFGYPLKKKKKYKTILLLHYVLFITNPYYIEIQL